MDQESIRTKIEKAFIEENSIDPLRQLALDLRRLGWSKEQVYQEFLAFHVFLQEQHRDQDADVLGDVMDMMTGWYLGRELEWD